MYFKVFTFINIYFILIIKYLCIKIQERIGVEKYRTVEWNFFHP
jgi:hypothetical protein